MKLKNEGLIIITILLAIGLLTTSSYIIYDYLKPEIKLDANENTNDKTEDTNDNEICNTKNDSTANVSVEDAVNYVDSYSKKN